MTKYLLANGVKKIIGFSRDEKKHYDFKKQFPDKRIELIIGDVRDYFQAINNAIKGRDVGLCNSRSSYETSSCL